MDEARDNLAEGTLVAGRYRVARELGRGGTGAVYEVRDERDARPLALKLLHARRVGPTSVPGALFEREYHTLCQLAHPRIIEVFDYGIADGRPFYTMELLDGQDLQSMAGLPWQKTCALLRDVASSLAIIHSRRLVHRDVSARNVRCTGDGRAKLLDFGAMVPMGVTRHIVGTPPYIAPEVLEMQALDGRADLYALGALAYYLITGYHAYEARSLDGLRSIWRSLPLVPGQYTEGIPAALDLLVMELLQLERAARPSSAAEVMERLSGIAGLTPVDLAAVKRSYLVMPSLVGRDAEVRVASDAIAAMLSSAQGGALCFEGERGVGRSRCLEACVLEARLRGVLLLRGDAADSAERGAYGLVSALCGQLWQADPDLCERIGQRHAASLAFLLPELADTLGTSDDSFDADDPDVVELRGGKTGTPPLPERAAILSAVQELTLGAARGRPIVIGIDDAHAIDEPSAALLGMLARVARQRPVLLMVTSDSSAQAGPALALLRDAASVVRLAPLDAEQHEALLRSVFGDVANVTALAAAIFEITHGNPLGTMTLAADLIERDLAHYESGGWSLPGALQASALPSSVSAALIARLATLPADARELADTLALVDATTLALDQYHALLPDADAARAYRALDDLLAAGILVRIGERFRFAQPALPPRLERTLSEDRKRALHRRLAAALQNGPLDARVVRHRLLGGDERTAIELMLDVYRRERLIEAQELQVVLTAIAAARRLGMSLQTRLELQAFLLLAAAAAGRLDLFLQPDAEDLLHHCQRACGLLDWAELPEAMEPSLRVAEARRRVRDRDGAAIESDRGLDPATAPATTVRVCGAYTSMAVVAQHLELLERLPRLDPLRAEVRAWDLMQATIDINRWVLEGRSTRALQASAALLQSLDTASQTAESGLSAHLRFANLHLVALFAATSGQAKVGALLAEFEQFPGLRSNAWRIRMVYELMRGNLELAAGCRRRAELLNLQDTGRVQFVGPTTRIELLAYVYAENLLGVKHVMENLAEFAGQYPGWRPTLAIARCHYRRLQGDAAGALAELEGALQTPAGRHLDWWLIAYSHVKVLSDLGRSADAVARGECYVDIWREQQLSSIDYGLQQVTAEALAAAGRLDDARRMIERYIRAHEEAGTRGLRLGLGYETAARIAMAARDEAAVNRYTARCAAEYNSGRDLLLKAKLDRLMHEAEQYGKPSKTSAVPVL